MKKKTVWVFKKCTAEVSWRDFPKTEPEEWHGFAANNDSDPEVLGFFESESEALEELKKETCGGGIFLHNGITYVRWTDYAVEEVAVEYDSAEETWLEAYEAGEVEYPGIEHLAPCPVTLEGVDCFGVETFPETEFRGDYIDFMVWEAQKKIESLPKTTADGDEIFYTIRVGGLEV